MIYIFFSVIWILEWMARHWCTAESRVGSLCHPSPWATHHALQEASQLSTAAAGEPSLSWTCFLRSTQCYRFHVLSIWKWDTSYLRSMFVKRSLNGMIYVLGLYSSPIRRISPTSFVKPELWVTLSFVLLKDYIDSLGLSATAFSLCLVHLSYFMLWFRFNLLSSLSNHFFFF